GCGIPLPAHAVPLLSWPREFSHIREGRVKPKEKKGKAPRPPGKMPRPCMQLGRRSARRHAEPRHGTTTGNTVTESTWVVAVAVGVVTRPQGVGTMRIASHTPALVGWSA